VERVGRSNRPWWLSRAATVSLIGLGFSAVYALALGWFIPRQVADEFLRAQAAADQAALDFLVSSNAIPTTGHLDFERLDRFVEQAILRGDFVRAKLWAVDGTILYSDAKELIGRRFVPESDFATMRSPKSEISDLDQPENLLEADQFGGRLLETYVPVLDEGETVAVWEIYRELDAYSASVAATQRLVWLGVGSGLGILGVFLISSFGLMIRAATEQKNQAEARSRDLATLLEVAQATTEFEDPESMARHLTALLVGLPEIESAHVAVSPSWGEERVLVDTGPKHPAIGELPAQVEVESTTSSGSTRVTIQPSAQWDASPTIHAIAEEINVGMQKALLTQGLNEYRQQLERVMEQMVAAEEGSRRRLAGEIHDNLAQDLYRILYGLRTLSADAPAELKPEFARIEEVVLDASRSVRHLLRSLHPTVAEDVGLAAALRSLADGIEEEYGLHVQLDLSECPEPTNEIKLAVYRIAQEALVNVAKHSLGKRADLRVVSFNGRVVVTIHNRASALDVRLAPGMGMWLMRERAETLGGHVDFQAGEGGVTVRAEIPIEAEP